MMTMTMLRTIAAPHLACPDVVGQSRRSDRFVSTPHRSAGLDSRVVRDGCHSWVVGHLCDAKQ